MAENTSNARAKKTLQSSKELAKTTREIVAKEKDKILEVIKNNIIERRIDEKEAKLRALTELYDENEFDAINSLKSDEALEKKKLSEDYESIVKKQLQMLQADERGKQALLNEISDIKKQQRKRSESLQARKKALLVEKERSRRIAALPPPLPRSVKLLLKEQEKKDSEAPPLSNSFYPQELYPVEEEFEGSEDKENMDEEEYHQQRRQLQEEWDRKAKKRFNEAIRKDRQKQEHDQILKEIENSEKMSRRQMAKNLSEPSGKVPCTLSDRLNHIEKQAVMEDAVESVFKKSNTTKEHVIEDLEGYEDKWEAKYKRIDSNLEEKMIDCVPNFVKQNYSYLLEEEPAQQCGNRFAKLDDSGDELNMAYIESPTEQINGSDRISAVISHLDRMMSESNEVYEKEFRPLLEAEKLKEGLPKTESFDKAVEANILKLPTEDKAIDAREEILRRNVVPSASRSTQADFMKSGVMAFKRRSLGSKNKSYLGNLSTTPSWVEPETTHPNGSWSSSSYLSLPSRHGQPDICNLCDSPSCRLPLVEDKSHHRDCIPLAKSHGISQEGISDEESSSSDAKTKILSYVQLVAEKYLKKTPVEVESQERGVVPREDEAIETPERIISGDLVESKESDLEDFAPISTSGVAIKQSTSEKAFEKISQKSRSSKMELPQIPPYSGQKLESGASKPKQDEFVKRCHEILSEKLSNIFSMEDGESEVLSALKSAISDDALDDRKRKLTPDEFIYHELSTILEMDSALTNDMPSLQDASKRTDISGISSISSLSRKSDEWISPEEVDTRSVSLVDVPISEASELAKSIRFVTESSEKPPDSMAQLFEPKTPLGLISGTLSSIQTPSPRVVSETQKSEVAKGIRFITELTEKPPDSAAQLLEPKTPLGLISGTLSNIQTPSPHGVSETQKSTSRIRIITESAKKPPESMLPESEPKTPLGLISGMLSMQSTSPGPVSEAPRPTSVITDHLATPSQMTLTNIHSNMSTPSTLKTKSSYSSRDLMTPTSQLSTHSTEIDVTRKTPYSSSFRFANVKYPFLTSLASDLPEYFRDISSIQQDSSSSQGENRSGENMKPADDKQTVPKTISSRVPVQQLFFPKDFDGKFGTDDNSSSSFKPMTPHSDISSPGVMDTDYDNKHTSSKGGNAYQRGRNLPKSTTELPHSVGSSQGSFKPMTPHSNISSPGTTYTDNDNKHASSKEGNAYQRERNLPKSTTELPHSVGSSQGSFKPMTPHSNISSPGTTYTDNDNKHASSKEGNAYQRERNLPKSTTEPPHSLGSSQGSFKPMTPRSYMSSPMEVGSKEGLNAFTSSDMKKSSSGKSNESQKTDDNNFQPMATYSYISSNASSMPRHKDFDSNSKKEAMEMGSRERFNAFTSRDMKKSSSRKSNESPKTDDDNFQPMATHSYISSNASSMQRHKGFDSSSKKEDIGHTMDSTSRKENKFSETENSGNDFRPMTPHSHISTPDFSSERQQHLDSESNNNRQEKYSTSRKETGWISAENSTSNFQPMTPHSNISTPNLPSQRHDLVSEIKNSQHGTRFTSQTEGNFTISEENSECGFQPMTPHSYLSTPNLPSQTHENSNAAEKYYRSPMIQENEGRGSVATDNSNGFQPMTPHSYISSQSSNTNISSEEDLRAHSSSSVNLKLRIPRNLISGTTSASDAQLVSDGQNENASVASSGLNKSLRLRFGIKAPNYMNPDADLEDYMLGDGSHMQRELPVKHLMNNVHEFKNIGMGYGSKNEVGNPDLVDTSNEQKCINAKKVLGSNFFVPQLSAADLAIAKDTQQDQELKKSAKVCSSDFFVPQLFPSDVPGLQKRYFRHELSDCPEVSSVGSSDLATCTDSLASISSVTSSGGKSMANKKELLRFGTGLMNEGSGSLSPSGSETPYFSVDSPNPILEALRKKFASDSSLKTPFSNSPCSSQGTLSDISNSKVNYQSTPIKTVEEIIQETGILDEPDLTLMTTELTMKPESPDNTRHFSEKSSIRKDVLAIPPATQNNTGTTDGLFKTPISGAAPSYADSPSMMSFLQHENSCFGDSKTEENSHLTHINSNEKLIYEDEFAGHQFGKNQPKYEYKKRTKRLWNNLEEVKTKKMIEERKKKSAENRLKMKAYSKVYNPLKKTPDH